MSQRIHHLDSLTIDQIAAGEVIDIPASCVKELVENSLDAGATDILVEIALGGRELIRVTDNGSGMGREDLVTSIERYATSKLLRIDDLEHIMSRGFRGEALASIVAISNVMITSAEQNIDGAVPICQGNTLVAQGGKIISVAETQTSPGTTVEVTSLFYNVPARRKFLKTPAKDTQDIIKAMTGLCLAAPSVSFRLICDGKQAIGVMKEESNPFYERIKALLKDPFQNDGFEVRHCRDGFSLNGYIADPRHARSTRSGQYLIVNGRPIFSLSISYAVKAAFGTTCEDGKHPVFALHLGLDPSAIDVNVHPQKRELRFADEEWVRMLVQEAVSEALFGKRGFASPSGFSACSYSSASASESVQDPFSIWRYEQVEKEAPQVLEIPRFSPLIAAPQCLTVAGDVALFRLPQKIDPSLAIPADALLLLDLRLAMRAIVFQDLEASSTQPLTELFLVPIVFDCSCQEAAMLADNLPLLEKMGFAIRSIGSQSFLVEGAPKPFLDLDLPKFLIDISSEGISLACDSVHEDRNKRMSSKYVGAMKTLRPPIETDVALTIFSSWSLHGYPRLSPDGQPCFSHLTPGMLKDWIAKGMSSASKKGLKNA
jgi:DNA mismatch repair protein MutL